jgi:FimV-like protein
LANAYLEIGKRAKARDVLEDLLRQTPRHEEAGRMLRSLEEETQDRE